MHRSNKEKFYIVNEKHQTKLNQLYDSGIYEVDLTQIELLAHHAATSKPIFKEKTPVSYAASLYFHLSTHPTKENQQLAYFLGVLTLTKESETLLLNTIALQLLAKEPNQTITYLDENNMQLMTLEEIIQKLNDENQYLLQQNQQLFLKDLNIKVKK